MQKARRVPPVGNPLRPSRPSDKSRSKAAGTCSGSGTRLLLRPFCLALTRPHPPHAPLGGASPRRQSSSKGPAGSTTVRRTPPSPTRRPASKRRLVRDRPVRHAARPARALAPLLSRGRRVAADARVAQARGDLDRRQGQGRPELPPQRGRRAGVGAPPRHGAVRQRVLIRSELAKALADCERLQPAAWPQVPQSSLPEALKLLRPRPQAPAAPRAASTDSRAPLGEAGG